MTEVIFFDPKLEFVQRESSKVLEFVKIKIIIVINLISVSKSRIWENGAELLIRRLEGVLKEGKRCLLLLSGGSAVNLYQRLAEYIDKSQFGSENLAVGQADERFQPDSPDEVNYRAIEKSGLIRVLKKKNISIYKIFQTENLAQSAGQYSRILDDLFKKYDYRMTVLGIGRDGHTAGLLPGYKHEWDKKTWVVGYENNGLYRQRISITAKTIGRLDYGMVVISGEEKREAMGKITGRRGNIDKIPGLLIHKIRQVDLVTEIKRGGNRN
ncbi:hypothetical protein A2W14_04670 [Candidatus Gottesmanbacteria bacterium RBG_16_37_8]|uniref:Glucosamine/galactosamine-6-phosphate isomerase domain-containing protein n=1 Tax=Candidatus Gottesmanbacteria bacterium RBG_16_37_8 TaxID=1798371 RepID=A0A1F5YT32_9BACT|nr:MAG: hypothetical protein A2W14_04670 [Candidatus Gottesmanbacteria bacterium RBG_16_37_8]